MNALVHLALLACCFVGFIAATDNANDAKNWPTAAMWAFLALFCIASGMVQIVAVTA